MGSVKRPRSFISTVQPTVNWAHLRWTRPLGSLLVRAAVIGCGAPAQAPARTDGSAPALTGGEAKSRRALVMAISREPESLEPSLQPQNRE